MIHLKPTILILLTLMFSSVASAQSWFDITLENGTEQSVTLNGDGTYTMTQGDVTISDPGMKYTVVDGDIELTDQTGSHNSTIKGGAGVAGGTTGKFVDASGKEVGKWKKNDLCEPATA